MQSLLVGDSPAQCFAQRQNCCLSQATASAFDTFSMVYSRTLQTAFSKILQHRLALTTENLCNPFPRPLYTDWKKHVLKVSNPFKENGTGSLDINTLILGLDAQVWVRISLELYSSVSNTDNFRKSKIKSNKKVTQMY